MLDPSEAASLLTSQMLPAWRAERERLDRIDSWLRWDHDKPHAPRQSTREYKELSERAQTPWLALVVTSVAQALYVDGYRTKGSDEDAPAWQAWQANGFDARQIALHRSALGYGLAYEVVLPGSDPVTGEPMPAMRGVSPRKMITFYEDEAEDDWPLYALRLDVAKIDGTQGYNARIYDDEVVHYLQIVDDKPTYLEYREHGAGVCPVVRFANQLDLEGRADGEAEPLIPLASRIDQTTFDRLVVQRFSSWVVRTIAGMAEPEVAADAAAKKLLLKVEDILVADDPDTKFGSLPATPLDGFIAAKDADLRDLASVSQTPPNHLLGQMANLSAEAIAAANASADRKVEERQHVFGESHEQSLRLAAHYMGDREGSLDVSAQVRWRDMESRSLAATADALGKMATMLGVPVEALWERIPGVTQQDIASWKELANQGDALGSLNALIERNMGGTAVAPPAA